MLRKYSRIKSVKIWLNSVQYCHYWNTEVSLRDVLWRIVYVYAWHRPLLLGWQWRIDEYRAGRRQVHLFCVYKWERGAVPAPPFWGLSGQGSAKGAGHLKNFVGHTHTLKRAVFHITRRRSESAYISQVADALWEGHTLLKTGLSAPPFIWMGGMTYWSPRNVFDSWMGSWQYFRTDKILLEA